MSENALHPNTQLLLTAWERMMSDVTSPGPVEQTKIHSELVDCLFVLERRDTSWLFRNAGDRMAAMLGRELGDQDFLGFWTGQDRHMVTALMSSVQDARKPGFMKALGETLVGKRIEVELTFAPLIQAGAKSARPRLLGLYQTLGSAAALNGRPVWRHRLTEIVPPDSSDEIPRMRLVASND